MKAFYREKSEGWVSGKKLKELIKNVIDNAEESEDEEGLDGLKELYAAIDDDTMYRHTRTDKFFDK